MISIVSGLPRSGTSLMMQMLEKGGMETMTDQNRKPDENNCRGYYEYEKVRSLQKDAAWIAEAEGKCVKIIAQLLYFLPGGFRYRILFMERHMEEIVRSQTAMLQNLGRTGAALEPAVLIKTFQDQTDKVRTFLSHCDHVQLMTVSYNTLIVDPQGESEKINRFFDYGLSVPAMVSAVEPSLYRQRI
ncbi:sulfotransferase family protein [bacterium]|nr:sulfotransferase family protein [bacterium]